MHKPDLFSYQPKKAIEPITRLVTELSYFPPLS